MNNKALISIPAILFTLVSSFFLFSCEATGNLECIDETKISEGPCTMEYAPVCGCDGKTYSNPCAASRSGLTNWKAGECN